eukprot:GHVU01038124.1.p2 GENE.GHVU01038124.1~~GHVU01038124.1.p2  ORF type:complete len:107 (+),score=11.72 GHVU01038124.1:930-1250(+)
MNAQVYNWETVSLRHGKREVRGHARVHAPTQTGNEEASNQEGKVASRQGGKQARWQAVEAAGRQASEQTRRLPDEQAASNTGLLGPGLISFHSHPARLFTRGHRAL